LEVALQQGENDDEGENGDQRPQPEGSSSFVQIAFAIAVVGFGCGNNITKQIAAKPLGPYTYMLGLATAVAYIFLYGTVLGVLILTKQVPTHQLNFVWKRTTQWYPYVIFFACAALADTLGDVIGMICTPYVSGPIHSLLSNCTVMFIAILALCVLSQRYSLLQVVSLLGVFVAVVFGILPSFRKDAGESDTNSFYAIVLGGSCFFNAVSFIIKEMLFTRYREWLGENVIQDDGGLHVFVVNTHAAIFQLPFTIMLIPLNTLFGQTHGEGIVPYMQKALNCVFSSSADSCSEGEHGEMAGITVFVYVLFNLAWNISILSSVKYSGALSTFVSLKAVFPVSSVMFAYINWPLLGKTEMDPLVWVSVALIVPAIATYQWASGQQQKRAAMQPSQATCFWPLGRQ